MWDCVIFVNEGPFANGSFKFELRLPDPFPSGQPPAVIFCSGVHHALVDPATRRLDLGRRFRAWHSPWDLNRSAELDPQTDWLWHALAFARSAFYDPDLLGALDSANPEAGRVYGAEPDSFGYAAQESVKEADTLLYDASTAFGIQFSAWHREKHQQVLDQILAGTNAEEIAW